MAENTPGQARSSNLGKGGRKYSAKYHREHYELRKAAGWYALKNQQKANIRKHTANVSKHQQRLADARSAHAKLSPHASLREREISRAKVESAKYSLKRAKNALGKARKRHDRNAWSTHQNKKAVKAAIKKHVAVHGRPSSN